MDDDTDSGIQDVDVGGGGVSTQAPQASSQPQLFAPSPESAGSTPSDQSSMESALSQEQEAKTAEAQARETQGNATAQAQGNAASAIASLPSDNDIVQNYAAKDKALAEQYASKNINPDHFWQNTSTGGKVAAGIGLLLSGFGAGASGQPNLAMKVIDDAITRDIDAQKNAQGQALNLYKMNEGNLSNATAANLATQNQLMTGLQYQIGQAANQSKGPIAMAQANQANALIEQQKVMNRQKLALFGGPTQESPDPSSKVGAMQRFGMITPEQAKESLEEIKNSQDINSLSPKILAAFDKGSSRNPNEAAQGQREFEGLINTTVKETEGTARQAAFDSIHKTMTPSGPLAGPGEDAVKRQTVQEYLSSKASAPFSKSIGIDLSKYPTTRAPQIAPKPVQQTQGGVPMKTVRFQGKLYKVPVQ